MIDWLWRLALPVLLLALATIAHDAGAATIGKSGGLALVDKGGITAEGVAVAAGKDFKALLNKPTTALQGGSTVFEDLLKMPFKPKDFPADTATVKSGITAKNLAKALRGGVGAYVAGEAIAALIKEACVRGMGGTLVMNESATFEECVPPKQSTGAEYRAYAGGQSSGFKPTREEACIEFVGLWNAVAGPYEKFNYHHATTTGCYGGWTWEGAGATGTNLGLIEGRDTACPAGWYIKPDGTCQQAKPEESYSPVSTTDAESKIENAINNPANASKVIPALKELIDKGGQVEVNPPTLSGPASSPVSTSQSTSVTNTTNGPVTITTTTTNVTNYTYNNSTVTASQVTNTTKKDAQGNTTESSTSEKVPDKTTGGGSDASEGPPADTPLPPVPDFYTQKYPNGLQGVWDDHKAAIKETSLFTVLDAFKPNLGDGGCPHWTIPLGPYGNQDASVPCWVWAFIRLVIIISALLLARRLIFGG